VLVRHGSPGRRWAHGSGGGPGGPTALRCSQLGAGSELTALAALVSFKHAEPSERWKRAMRAPQVAALLSHSQIAQQRLGPPCACIANAVLLHTCHEPGGGASPSASKSSQAMTAPGTILPVAAGCKVHHRCRSPFSSLASVEFAKQPT